MKKNVWYRGVIMVGLLAIVQTASADWQKSNAAQGNVFCFGVSETNIFAGGNGAILYSSDTGTNWSLVDSGLPKNKSITSIVISGTNIFAGTGTGSGFNSGSGIYLSPNNGAFWTPIDSGLPSKTALASCLAVSGSNIFATIDAVPTHSIYISANNGTSWSPVDSGLPKNINYVNYFTFLTAIGTTIFTGGANGGVFFSTNNGMNWTAVDSGLITTLTVRALAAIGTNLFAATDVNGIYLSTNNGARWTAVDSGLPNKSTTVSSFAVSGANIFAGTNAGVYLSTNSGTSWTAVNSGLSISGPVYALAVSGRYLFAGNNSSLWRRPLSEMLSATPVIPYNQNTPDLQTKLRVSASVTAHSGIKVNYSLASRCKVRLGIYTVAGEKVISFDQGERAPGTFSVRLPADKIQAGLYICRFQAGSYRESALVRVTK